MRLFSVCVWILIACLVLNGCGGVTTLNFVVPDGYTGLVVVRYNCPGGAPLSRAANGHVHIVFDDTGVACLAASYPDVFPSGVWKLGTVQTRSQRRIPALNDARKATGDVFTTTSPLYEMREADGTISFTLSVFWLGDAAALQQMTQSGQYSNELYALLARTNIFRFPIK